MRNIYILNNRKYKVLIGNDEVGNCSNENLLLNYFICYLNVVFSDARFLRKQGCENEIE